jgi:hypothetical protein
MKRAIFPIAIAIFISAGLSAQELSGSVEARLGWYLGSSELLPLTQVFTAGLGGKAGDKDMPTAQYSARLAVSYDPKAAATTLELGETWVKLFAGPFDISVGNQVLAWGSTDVFPPSDIANPQDLGLPVDPVKLPVPMGRIVYNGAGLMIDVEAQPFWIPPRLPAAPWVAVSPLSATVTPIPHNWDNVSYGGHAKLSLDLLQGLDLGFTAFRGRNHTPTPTVNYTGGYPSSITLDYDRMTLIGADAVFAVGEGLLLKTDWGYKTLRDTSLVAPVAGAASLQGVSGFEYRIGPVQIIGEYVLDWAKGQAASGDSFGHSVVGIASADLGDRASLKIAAVHEWKGGSGMIAPRLSYILADGFNLNCDVFFFYGGPGTTYGAWKDDSLGKISLKYSF